MTTAALEFTLRVARGAAAQQAAIDDWLATRGDARRAAIVAEGAWFPLRVPAAVPVARLAAGCPCCVGPLPLRVALARMVRVHRPACVLLLIADGAHQDKLRALLAGGALGVSFEETP